MFHVWGGIRFILDINTLYQTAQAGDQQAEEQLFAALTDSFRLFAQQRVLNTEDAQEVIQDALTIISLKYRDIQFTKSFAAWAYKVLRNKLSEYYRAKGTRKERTVGMEDCDPVALSYLPDPELTRRIRSCLEKIGRWNNRYARIILLRIQGYSGDEISAQLGVTKNSILVTLSRARAKLKICLEKGELE